HRVFGDFQDGRDGLGVRSARGPQQALGLARRKGRGGNRKGELSQSLFVNRLSGLPEKAEILLNEAQPAFKRRIPADRKDRATGEPVDGRETMAMRTDAMGLRIGHDRFAGPWRRCAWPLDRKSTRLNSS